MANNFSIEFDQKGINAGLDDLAAKAKGSARAAAYAGAVVFYDEVKVNVAKHTKSGKLYEAIYHAFSPENSNDERATYHVGWNHKKAPHGQLVEFGHRQTHKAYIGSDGTWYSTKVKLAFPRQIPAQPFLRPAFDSKAQAALQAANARWVETMRKVSGVSS